MKNKVVSIALSLLSTVLLVQCSSTNKATSSHTQAVAAITKEGFIDCFEKDLSSGGKPVWCEASAILYDGMRLLLANDKDMPGSRSSVFSLKASWLPSYSDTIDKTDVPVYMGNSLLKKASKYEDFAITPDKNIELITTAFDRVKPNSREWDNYNTILYWTRTLEEYANVLTAPSHEKDSTSISLRPLITAALKSKDFPDGPPYYKIEGLAVTDKKLLLGIREEGARFDSFHYCIKILTAPYKLERGKISLSGKFTLLSDINTSSIQPGPYPIAISSIEYDPYNNRFYVLTSYEQEANLGGYLWTATANDLLHNRLIPVKDSSGQIIHFTHKCEDLAIINQLRIIVIHDDDRATLPVNGVMRKPYQTAYSVVDFR